jgi:hypothetical protein
LSVPLNWASTSAFSDCTWDPTRHQTSVPLAASYATTLMSVDMLMGPLLPHCTSALTLKKGLVFNW